MTTPAEEKGGEFVEPPENGRAATCYRCTHVNAPGRGTCTKCGAHLFIRCKDCGARNARIQPRCVECGRRMHHSALSKLKSRLKGTQGTIPKGVILFAVAIILLVIAYVVIFGMDNFKLPAAEGDQ